MPFRPHKLLPVAANWGLCSRKFHCKVSACPKAQLLIALALEWQTQFLLELTLRVCVSKAKIAADLKRAQEEEAARQAELVEKRKCAAFSGTVLQP